jgi:hypothetical protein
MKTMRGKKRHIMRCVECKRNIVGPKAKRRHRNMRHKIVFVGKEKTEFEWKIKNMKSRR